jgi:UDP-N-acetylglucosamine 2-epimerase (non-hydrolysing)
MKLMIVVGARPNFMKAAPILDSITRYNASLRSDTGSIHVILVHTGQHYDSAMSDAFFSDLNLRRPDVFLGAGSGSHAAQTAEVMKRFEQVLLREQPDVLVLVGDVNSTVACALVAAKISYDAHGTRPLIAHVEAGLRSFDRNMPEECNRVVTDHLSDLLFVTEESALKNLDHEGVPKERVFFVGNTMIDSLRAFEAKAEVSTILERLDLLVRTDDHHNVRGCKPYVLLTLHRPSNVDSRETFLEILEGIQEITRSYEIIFPAHPRTQKQIQQLGLGAYFALSHPEFRHDVPQSDAKVITLVEPQGYLDFLCLMKHARLVITDSGGIQEETTCLHIPCVTVRENTERPVTLTSGTNMLGGTRRDGIRKAIQTQLAQKREFVIPEMWDGKASGRIVQTLTRQFKQQADAEQMSPVDYGKTVLKEAVCPLQ